MLEFNAMTLRSLRLAQRVAEQLPASWYAVLRKGWHRLRLSLPTSLAARRFDGIPGRIHAVDYMHRDVDHFVAAGQDAVRNLDASLDAAGRVWADVTRFLDYGCGYGRVMRWLTGRGFEIVGADVNPQAVAFCAAEFGAVPFVIPLTDGVWDLPRRFDLIWVGSVFTHLSPSGCEALLQRLADALAPNGVLVFTTHGEMQGAGDQYGKDVFRNAATIRATMAAGGVAFVPARENPEWGQTFHSRTAVRDSITRTGLRLVSEAPRGWDQHQDVWTAVASRAPASRE